ncbi:MAG: hypothetical protein AAF329_24190 [Cyanobacteria bacterium P01_A01_bin.17]
MAQYYRFVNLSRQEVSQISLPFNFALPYAKSLERYDRMEVAAIFRYVIRHNTDWTVEDELVAEGDYGEVVRFNQAQPSDQTYAWESYVPEIRHPQPL